MIRLPHVIVGALDAAPEAEAHGVHDFDDEHMVCIGRGQPIGTPIVDVDAEPEFWTPFEHVDRSRGDTLLGIGWNIVPPEVWFA